LTIAKEQHIDRRRQTVLELSSEGLTQQEIASKLLISQKTVSNDLAWLKKDSIEFLKKNRENVAFDYHQALSNFYQLRKEAWKQFNSTKSETIKTSLYDILESINNNIMTLSSVGDIIEKEVTVEQLQAASKETKEELQEIVG
jgi:predicted transcriptional regulator